MSKLKQPLDGADDATMTVWWWLRANVKDGLLLSICLAIIEADEEALKDIAKSNFARNYGVAEVSSIGCNKALLALGLAESLRTGFASLMGAGSQDVMTMNLISETHKTVVSVSKYAAHDELVIKAMVEQSVPIVSFGILKLRDALIKGVEAKLRVC